MLNKVTLLGNLGKDPETKEFANNNSLTKFDVVTTETWIDRQTGEKKQSNEWHSIEVRNGLGETCQRNLRKGSKVLIEGKLTTNRWEDAKGVSHKSVVIKATNVVFL